MFDLLFDTINWLHGTQAMAVLRAILLLLVGILLARAASGAVGRSLSKRTEAHSLMLWKRLVFFALLFIFVVSALRELGFRLNVLLGAAGIFSVALGFASQTSASNLISGLFLLSERPFRVGDVITVGTTTGEVLSVDLLSVKLRTFDNLYVRLPNETLIKSEITNLTRFPIRRFDLQMGVAHSADLAQVKALLFEVADTNPLCLEEPKPLFIHQGFADNGVRFQFSVWAKRELYLDLRNSLMEEIQNRFKVAGIEIPYPQHKVQLIPGDAPLIVTLKPHEGAPPPGPDEA